MQTCVEQLLIEQRPSLDKKLDLIAAIFDALESDPSHTVQSVALMLSLSERALQALFHNYVGVGLKWVMLRLRLQRAAAVAAQTQAPNWAAIAADLGYADQAHFVNDFKRIIGTPPGHYAAVQSRA